jgi:ADP-ribosylglycohydrolase
VTVDIRQRFFNVVVASRVGDAMGTPTEGLTPEEVASGFGWVNDFQGDGTDDSLMATILAGTLTQAHSFSTADEWATEIHRHRPEILAKQDKFFASVLHMLEKLDVGYRPSDVALGNMPSSSSAMCIWPVALVHAGQPEAAARQAYELARLIHVNEADHCTDGAAALAAAIASAFLPDSSIRSCVAEALTVIRPVSGALLRDTLRDALQLVATSDSFEDFRAQYQARFLRPIFCDSLETVPAAFALATLADGDVRTAVEYAANFGRDSDTIGTMAGALCGALATELPQPWIASLGHEAVDSARQLAGQLLDAAADRTRRERDTLEVAAALLDDGLQR